MTLNVTRLEELDFQQKITSKDIQDESNKELVADLIWKIDKDYKEAEDAVSSKLQAFENYYEKYTNPWVFKTNYVKSYVLHQHLEMFIATFKDADLSVSFTGRDISDDDQAYKLNKAAEYDEEAMGKKRKDFFHLWNVWFYGAAPRIKVWYNKVKKLMEYLSVSPIYWKPDPNGDSLNDNYDYHYFDMVSSLSELMSANKSNPGTYFNLDKIHEDPDDRQGKGKKKTQRLLSDNQLYRERFRTTQGYITISGRKYMVTLANQNSLIIRWEEIKPVFDEEKKNPSLVKFPVVVSQLFPLEDDPFGIGYAELILDFQNAKNRLLNLAIMKEQENAWFEQVLVDFNKIANLELLTEKAEGGRIYIPADGDGWPLSNAIAPIRSDRNDVNTFSVIDRIDNEAQTETGMTSLQRGVGSRPGTTFGEAKIEQINSNIKFGLYAEMLSYWEIDFWRMWHRTLVENMSDTDEKIFRTGSEIDSSTVKLTKSEMLSGIDPDVSVVSRKAKKQEDEKLLAHMAAEWPLMVQNPNIPQVSKNMFKRKLDQLKGLSRERAFLNTPMTADEKRAKRYIPIINAELRSELSDLFKPGMDYFTYWVYFDRCDDNELKAEIMTALEDAMIEKGLNVPQPMWGAEDMTNVSNSMGSQMTSAVVQGGMESFGVPSREQI